MPSSLGSVPKLLNERSGAGGVIGHPCPQLNWSFQHLQSFVVFPDSLVSGIGTQVVRANPIVLGSTFYLKYKYKNVE